MRKQSDITPGMRAILIDWLVEVAEEYKIHNETLFLAVSFIDRFLSHMSVLRGKLQLVGTAAMFIASWVYHILEDLNLLISMLSISSGNTRKSILLRLESSCTSPMTRTPRSKSCEWSTWSWKSWHLNWQSRHQTTSFNVTFSSLVPVKLYFTCHR